MKTDSSLDSRQLFYQDQVRQCQDRYRAETGFSRRYAVETYGCQLNENDSERIAGLLDAMGFIPAPSAREADFVLLNTCSIRQNAEDRLFGNLGHLKSLRKDRPDLIIAVCGCMMKQEENVDRIDQKFSFVDLIFGPQDIHRLPEFVYTRLVAQRRMYSVGDEDQIVEGLPVHRARRFRALVSIMFGCNNFCTYCIVPYTRGRERSRNQDEILRELAQLDEEGFQEVMLLGQNVNSYGHDRGNDEGQDAFAKLLATAATRFHFSRIRFMTSHPKDISPQLLAVMRDHAAIERHLHLPLQSGSDRVLARMNRRYDQKHFLDIAQKARQMIPGLSISTDLIVGFPGETEADFEETLKVMREVKFDSAFTFQFSPRPGTPAAQMDDPVDAATVRERFQRMIDLQNEHSLSANRKLVGTLQEVLIEGRSSTDALILSGRTRCNRLINFSVPDPKRLPASCLDDKGQVDGETMEGKLAQVRLTQAKTFSMTGQLETIGS